MADDLKKMYRTIMDDHFPPQMEISFVDRDQRQTLFYEKVTWTIEGIQKGLRYGENPGQEAALYRMVNGNLVLGEIETLQPGQYLASDIELLQSGKHPGKTNLTDADNSLNILRYFTNQPTAVIVKHNNPCGVAQAETLEQAYVKANLADRVAAFGGCIALNRSVDKAAAEAVVSHVQVRAHKLGDQVAVGRMQLHGVEARLLQPPCRFGELVHQLDHESFRFEIECRSI